MTIPQTTGDRPLQPMKDALAIISGGMDSTSMLYEYRDDIALGLSFHYGSKHNDRELAFAKRHCERLGIRHVVITLPFVERYFKSSLLCGGEEIPEGHYADDNMKSTVVPFRNGIMLAIAAGIAESNGLTRLMIANHGGDHAIYPDCRPEFVTAMSEAISAGTYERLRIFAPYTDITKSDIAVRGARCGVDFVETWSCYKGGERHCGRCGTCVERKEAFRKAGLEDPTIYDE